MDERENGFIQKHDLLGCIQCGRCTGGCPVTARSGLNVRGILRGALDEDLLQSLAGLPEIWDCTACGNCSLRCPKGLKPLDVLVALRSILVEGGVIQPSVRDALESIFREGNPWDKPRAARFDWRRDLDLKVVGPGEAVHCLVFVCCTVAYDPRLQGIAGNLGRLLNYAGVHYGFMEEGETCCASEAYCLGEEGLFEMMVEDNSELLNSYSASRIITISPHCYSAFKNQYPQLRAEILHYTELLAELLREGKMELNRELKERIVYHDPCFLGKQNGVFNDPRFILQQLPGAELVEFERTRERSLCCEGGGGKMWVESESRGERLAAVRVREAKMLGAGVLAAACPFCLLTLEDAVKAEGWEDEIKVAEILEIAGGLIQE